MNDKLNNNEYVFDDHAGCIASWYVCTMHATWMILLHPGFQELQHLMR